MRCNDVLTVALGLTLAFATPTLVQSQTSGVATVAASDGPGGAASWTTGNKLAVGASAGTDSKVWFTVAKGITSEIFYPRLDVPNMEDMQYIITDGSTFVDLERDATSHVISMPIEDALEYIVTNTDRRQSPKYRITNTYVTDPSRDTLLIRTRFESLDGGVYQLYLHANPSIAGGGANNSAWWDGTHSALMASGTRTLFGSPMTIVSVLKLQVQTASSRTTTALRRWRAIATSNCIRTWPSSPDSTAQATAMLSNAARSGLLARIRRSRSRSDTEATLRQPLPRRRDRLQPDSRIGRPPTAKAGATMSTGFVPLRPAC